MSYKVIVPKPISEAIGAFGLSRENLIQLLSRMHHDIPRDYPKFRQFRIENAEDKYRYWLRFVDSAVRHLFTFAIDDSTAQGLLIVADIAHDVR